MVRFESSPFEPPLLDNDPVVPAVWIPEVCWWLPWCDPRSDHGTKVIKQGDVLITVRPECELRYCYWRVKEYEYRATRLWEAQLAYNQVSPVSWDIDTRERSFYPSHSWEHPIKWVPRNDYLRFSPLPYQPMGEKRRFTVFEHHGKWKDSWEQRKYRDNGWLYYAVPIAEQVTWIFSFIVSEKAQEADKERLTQAVIANLNLKLTNEKPVTQSEANGKTRTQIRAPRANLSGWPHSNPRRRLCPQHGEVWWSIKDEGHWVCFQCRERTVSLYEDWGWTRKNHGMKEMAEERGFELVSTTEWTPGRERAVIRERG